jgi:hypothetical protein
MHDLMQKWQKSPNGPYLAQTLSQSLGYQVRLNEPFYTNGCTTSSQCVFPNAIIPMSAWGTAPKRMLQYIPVSNIADGTFSSGAYKRRINDNKFGGRLDFNSNQFGTPDAAVCTGDHSPASSLRGNIFGSPFGLHEASIRVSALARHAGAKKN